MDKHSTMTKSVSQSERKARISQKKKEVGKDEMRDLGLGYVLRILRIQKLILANLLTILKRFKERSNMRMTPSFLITLEA